MSAGHRSTFRSGIPRQAIYRLSVYFRCLRRLSRESVHTVSSGDLAKAAGVKPTQLRKDLTYFGHFGTRGLGYDVELLSRMISDLLGTNSLQPVILIGVGNLGSALVSYRGFSDEGFKVVGAFDLVSSRSKRRPSIAPPILSMRQLHPFVSEHGIKMAILTVPAKAAQDVVDRLVEAGITGILNFAPAIVEAPECVTVHNVNLAIELENLSYFVNGSRSGARKAEAAGQPG